MYNNIVTSKTEEDCVLPFGLYRYLYVRYTIATLGFLLERVPEWSDEISPCSESGEPVLFEVWGELAIDI
jgi:hypothetical protein